MILQMGNWQTVYLFHMSMELVLNWSLTYLDLKDTTDGDLEARPLEE